MLDDNDVLVESYAILDEIDQMVGSEKALCPPHGAERRRVMKLTAIAVASMEKAQWAFYEPRFRPPEKVHQPQWFAPLNPDGSRGLRHGRAT